MEKRLAFTAVSGIKELLPSGDNSTMFTECCNTAILDGQGHCPNCGNAVIGHDADTPEQCGRMRWAYATRNWNRSGRN